MCIRDSNRFRAAFPTVRFLTNAEEAATLAEEAAKVRTPAEEFRMGEFAELAAFTIREMAQHAHRIINPLVVEALQVTEERLNLLRAVEEANLPTNGAERREAKEKKKAAIVYRYPLLPYLRLRGEMEHLIDYINLVDSNEVLQARVAELEAASV